MKECIVEKQGQVNLGTPDYLSFEIIWNIAIDIAI